VLLPTQLAIHRQLIPVFHPPKTPASRTCMCSGPSVLMPASIASAHCLPALVCMPMACLVPSVQFANSVALPAGPTANEKCQFSGPYQRPSNFWPLIPSPGHPGTKLKIWRQSPPPRSSPLFTRPAHASHTRVYECQCLICWQVALCA